MIISLAYLAYLLRLSNPMEFLNGEHMEYLRPRANPANASVASSGAKGRSPFVFTRSGRQQGFKQCSPAPRLCSFRKYSVSPQLKYIDELRVRLKAFSTYLSIVFYCFSRASNPKGQDQIKRQVCPRSDRNRQILRLSDVWSTALT